MYCKSLYNDIENEIEHGINSSKVYSKSQNIHEDLQQKLGINSSKVYCK